MKRDGYVRFSLLCKLVDGGHIANLPLKITRAISDTFNVSVMYTVAISAKCFSIMG